MKRPVWLLLLGVAFAAGIGVGTLGILYATGGLSEPSVDTAAVVPTLSLSDPTLIPGDLAQVLSEIATLNAKVDAVATVIAMGGVAAASEVDATPLPATPLAQATPERALFRINADESEARFIISETLFGTPTEVVGSTRRVAGDIIVNLANPAASQVGSIAINARTIKTDNEFRDQSIRGQILESSKPEFEFITFVPQELLALSETPVAVGQTVQFQVSGDLTIRGETRRVTFDLELTPESLERISGLATTEVTYADFGITVNPPPNVADVGATVRLELAFIAVAVAE